MLSIKVKVSFPVFMGEKMPSNGLEEEDLVLFLSVRPGSKILGMEQTYMYTHKKGKKTKK